MFSNSVRRIVLPTAAAASSSTCTASTAASSVRGVAAVSHRSHQRRLSSSKTSVPPDNAKRVAIEQGKQKNAEGGRGTRKNRVRTTRANGAASEKKAALVPLSKLYPDLPEPVRNTNHLRREDLAVMQLFAGHLPISPNHIIPQPVSDDQFEAIFKPKPHWQKYKDTLDQLNGAIATLEEAGVVEGVDDAVEIVHLDAADSVADPLSHYYRMNRPPPPPRPVDEFEHENAKAPRRRPRKGKSWQTTITVTEWTDGQGHRTFHADSTPIVRVPHTEIRVIEEPLPTQDVSIRQPFLERMRARQEKWHAFQTAKIREATKKPKMLLISVRRQRKVKMKKHKLKKLRKRTRNLRRKLGKL
ncbi:uncharacterized protein PV09_05189 [Verruconis gallopava]|uniref:Small ribosomal subunit protein mS38 n=1 Tax=Verruconis gallopava TaxID=253628 RepID=A0A0D2AW77_9PEZI|nr:uncharacterized protein PV09_05189 [Verruconis gallopava]KIW03414.1 hypothetical protein PV09_05189 [Verruconis gallopava]